MNTTKCLALLMVAVGFYGCASPASDEKKEVVSVRLSATPRNAGEIARATLAPWGNETDISLMVSGVPSSVTRPVHLYTFIYSGTCARPSASPAYELNRTITTYRLVQGDVWRLSRSAPVPLSTLRSGDYSIVLRTTPVDGDFDIFCGDIR